MCYPSPLAHLNMYQYPRCTGEEILAQGAEGYTARAWGARMQVQAACLQVLCYKWSCYVAYERVLWTLATQNLVLFMFLRYFSVKWMFLTFTHFRACAYSSFILVAEEFNIVKLHHTYLRILLLMNTWGFSFSFFTNFLVPILWHTCGRMSEGYLLRGRISGSDSVHYLTLLNSTQLFFKIIIPTYCSTRHGGKFSLWHVIN